MNKQANDIFNIIDKQSPHLSWARDRTVLLSISGSVAYGTNTPTSDIDLKGICIPTLPYFLGSQHRIEQIELKAPNPDCVIYDIRKFFDLASNSNPSILDVMFADPSDQIVVDPIGKEIIEHRKEFLSKKVRWTYTGYMWGQVKRLQLHREHIINPPKAPPTRKSLGLPEQTLIPQDQLVAIQAEIQKEMDRFQFNFMENLDEPTKIGIRNVMTEMLAELKITTDQHWESSARKIGLSDNLIQVMQRERQYTGAKRTWDQFQHWKATRNPERYAMEEKFGYDGKFATHIVRLGRQGREIMTTGEVQTKRPDAKELLEIRNGSWTFEQLMAFVEKEDEAMKQLYTSSNVLPKAPNREKLDQLCISLVESSLSKYSWYSVKKQLMSVFG